MDQNGNPVSWEDFDEWVEFGWRKGWIGPPVCYTHDGLPLSADEMDEWSEGHDPCIHVLRLYEGADHRLSVESNDPPTNWRASNLGWTRD